MKKLILLITGLVVMAVSYWKVKLAEEVVALDCVAVIV